MASFTEFLGAFLLGNNTTSTIRSGIIDVALFSTRYLFYFTSLFIHAHTHFHSKQIFLFSFEVVNSHSFSETNSFLLLQTRSFNVGNVECTLRQRCLGRHCHVTSHARVHHTLHCGRIYWRGTCWVWVGWSQLDGFSFLN